MVRLSSIILLLLSLNLSAQSKQKQALWVVRYALADQEESEQIIRSALLLKTTDIYVQVRASAQLFFEGEQKLTVAAKSKAAKNFRHLKNMAAIHNIKVHAWLNILNIWSSPNLPEDRSHLAYTSSGSILRAWSKKHTPIKTLHKLGVEGYFMDPADAHNLENIKAIIKLLAEEFKVDGIHLDYFRYPPIEVTSSPSLRTRFILQEYIDPEEIYTPDAVHVNKEISSFVAMDKLYKKFLSKSLTHLLSNLRLYINSLARPPELSIAVKPNPLIAKAVYFQNWAQWLKENLCDYVVTMNYIPEAETFADNLQACSDLNLQDKIVIGIASYNQDLENVLQKIALAQLKNFAGYSIFSYNSLIKNKMLLPLAGGLNELGRKARKSIPKEKQKTKQ